VLFVQLAFCDVGPPPKKTREEPGESVSIKKVEMFKWNYEGESLISVEWGEIMEQLNDELKNVDT